MTNTVHLPAVRKSRLPALIGRLPSLRRETDFSEFLPAHLEILETPASPRMALMVWLLCGMLVATLAWSYFCSLDIYAEAQGRIQPSGRSKVVQPVDAGRVRSIEVANGTKVKAGDLLIELDPTESSADRAAAQAELESLRAEIARRTAEIATVRNDVRETVVDFPDDVSAPIRARETSLINIELGSYFSKRESLNAQIAEKVARNKRLISGMAARERVVALMQERVGIRTTLESQQAGTHSAVIDASQTMENEQRNLADDKGQVLENDAAKVSLQRSLDQIRQQFLETQTQRLTDAQRQRAKVEQDFVKATVRAQRTRLLAPIDGIVQQLAVTTVGQVVTVGQPLLVVVPSDGTLEVVALVQNEDIGFIKIGQEAVLKVDSFPFSHYGTLKGTVSRISMEAVDAQEAGVASNANTLARPTNLSALSPVPRVQNLIYPVYVTLDRHSLNVDGKDVPLLPGMTVTAEILTGSRRMIQYILSPVSMTSSEAAHER